MSRYRPIAGYYDAEYERLPMLQRDVPFLLRHLPRRPRSVLALACGTGRAAVPLAQAGHRVVGVDVDPAMLAVARRKRDAVGLTDRSLSLREADVLTLDLDRRFDWVCLMFNTLLNFPELPQLDAVLRAVVRHLKPGGRFWVDVLNPDPRMLAEPAMTDLDPVSFHVPALDRTVMRTIDVRRDPAPQVQRVTHRYTWFDVHGRQRTERVTFRMTFLFPRELRLLLERHGLVIEQSYGDYDGSPVTADCPRLVACCRRSRGRV